MNPFNFHIQHCGIGWSPHYKYHLIRNLGNTKEGAAHGKKDPVPGGPNWTEISMAPGVQPVSGLKQISR